MYEYWLCGGKCKDIGCVKCMDIGCVFMDCGCVEVSMDFGCVEVSVWVVAVWR